ncbi:MAG TPA: MmgE/PrpD family protein [Burkholderiales bacterium]|nr:MmgE/PrpD family protein [Burkholderiales bacterium]
MPGLTQQLAEFVAALRFEALPAEAVQTVTRGAIDCIGVLFAGRDEPVVGVVGDIVPPGSEAQVLFDRGRASAPDAALLNGTAAHALDYDDTGIDGHPSVVLVPAALAEGERTGASGAELIAAYVAGYETWAELVARDADKHHGKGWHPTAVFGTVAAAAAAARLAKLDAARTASALGIAASLAAGLVANFGSMTKPFQAGRAAQSGLLAARLAAAGMSAAPDALEHRAGFLRALSPAGRVRTDGEIAAGREWHILRHGLNVKRYPVCYALHRSIDGALELIGRHDLHPEQVAGVELRIGRLQAGMLRHSRPRTALDAKFSAEFAMASALVARRVGLAELSDEFVRSAAVQTLMPKVRVSTHDEPDPEEPLFAAWDAVSIALEDGRTLAGEPVRHARGHARNPVGLEELRVKFDDCVSAALPDGARAKLWGQLLALETLPRVSALYHS